MQSTETKHIGPLGSMKPFSDSVSDWIPRDMTPVGFVNLSEIASNRGTLLKSTTVVGGGNPNIFGIFTPIFWGNKIPYLTCAYFSDMICWVETTNQTNCMKPQKLMGLEDESPFSTLGLIRLGFFCPTAGSFSIEEHPQLHGGI